MQYDFIVNEQTGGRDILIEENFGVIRDSRGKPRDLAGMKQLCIYAADRQNERPLACGPVEP